MWKALFITICATLLSSASALACSCFCNYNHLVSEYFEDNKMFWGVPVESHWNDGQDNADRDLTGWVVTKVRVVEGYGQLEDNSIATVLSAPDDGVSCGKQLSLGAVQMIASYGEGNSVDTCNCVPPIAASLDYLNKGKDRFLPNPRDCENNKDRRASVKKQCKIWDSDWKEEVKERRRIYKKFRERDSQDDK